MGKRFPNVSCSECGREFGPGDHGFSHCDNHSGEDMDKAKQTADAIMRDLDDRKGVLADIDDDILQEIRDEIVGHVAAALASLPAAQELTDEQIKALAEQAGYAFERPDYAAIHLPRLKAFARLLSTQSADRKPPAIAYMRRWAFEGRDPVNGEGRKLLPVTMGQCLPNDVPLAAITEQTKKVEA